MVSLILVDGRSEGGQVGLSVGPRRGRKPERSESGEVEELNRWRGGRKPERSEAGEVI